MKELQVIEYHNQRILTTQQLAEFYETDIVRISQNYIRNMDKYQEGVHNFKLEGSELKKFKTDYLIDSALNASSIMLWTEKGALLHAKSLNTDKAWEVYQELVDTYYRVKELSPYQSLSPELQAIFATDKKVQQLESKVNNLDEKVDNQITVSYNQANEIQKAVSNRVVELLGGKDTLDYKHYKGSYFSQLHRDLKDRLGVPSYRDIRKIDYQSALGYIKAWLPKVVDKTA
ncbi:ORF6C domain-containing protein [Ruminiclostridium papyrosolvens]|uniref:Antirepressor n=1 Tax=Ruminiclostridium papyrosolvens C7 TaxID=1330534 RepID=U4R047_9FIRM|nr:ORF6C domain-containing protein [Ruminiclostridium papyrosolvens]EPR10119.1 antirepressor [Ruminiclostridium papyrosolvens C7]